MSREPKQLEHLTQRELATVLAALRAWQDLMEGIGPGPMSDSYMEIASESDTLEPLDSDEIDDLCERING